MLLEWLENRAGAIALFRAGYCSSGGWAHALESQYLSYAEGSARGTLLTLYGMRYAIGHVTKGRLALSPWLKVGAAMHEATNFESADPANALAAHDEPYPMSAAAALDLRIGLTEWLCASRGDGVLGSLTG